MLLGCKTTNKTKTFHRGEASYTLAINLAMVSDQLEGGGGGVGFAGSYLLCFHAGIISQRHILVVYVLVGRILVTHLCYSASILLR